MSPLNFSRLVLRSTALATICHTLLNVVEAKAEAEAPQCGAGGAAFMLNTYDDGQCKTKLDPVYKPINLNCCIPNAAAASKEGHGVVASCKPKEGGADGEMDVEIKEYMRIDLM